jgi:hypothetical protein
VETNLFIFGFSTATEFLPIRSYWVLEFGTAWIWFDFRSHTCIIGIVEKHAYKPFISTLNPSRRIWQWKSCITREDIVIMDLVRNWIVSVGLFEAKLLVGFRTFIWFEPAINSSLSGPNSHTLYEQVDRNSGGREIEYTCK